MTVLNCNEGFVKAVAFSPDGKRLASGDSDGQVKLWAGEAGHPRPFSSLSRLSGQLFQATADWRPGSMGWLTVSRSMPESKPAGGAS